MFHPLTAESSACICPARRRSRRWRRVTFPWDQYLPRLDAARDGHVHLNLCQAWQSRVPAGVGRPKQPGLLRAAPRFAVRSGTGEWPGRMGKSVQPVCAHRACNPTAISPGVSQSWQSTADHSAYEPLSFPLCRSSTCLSLNAHVPVQKVLYPMRSSLPSLDTHPRIFPPRATCTSQSGQRCSMPLTPSSDNHGSCRSSSQFFFCRADLGSITLRVISPWQG